MKRTTNLSGFNRCIYFETLKYMQSTNDSVLMGCSNHDAIAHFRFGIDPISRHAPLSPVRYHNQIAFCPAQGVCKVIDNGQLYVYYEKEEQCPFVTYPEDPI